MAFLGPVLHKFLKWRAESEGTRLARSEKKKQGTFESIDYHSPFPLMYLKHLQERFSRQYQFAELDASASNRHGIAPRHETVRSELVDAHKPRLARWLLHLMIAVAVGVWTSLILTVVLSVENWRSHTVADLVRSSSFRSFGHLIGLGFWMITAGLFAAMATLSVVYVEPAAAGSGIPDLIAYLNGVLMHKVMGVKTFFVKSFSCVAATVAGMPIGLEAPLIHLGAIIGAGVSQGRSRTLGVKLPWLGRFRGHKDRRDFITAGAACGVSAAFGAPIGGLLFVMEEVASFWDHSASGQVFLATLITFATGSLLTKLFLPSSSSRLLFEVDYSLGLNLVAVFPSILLGLICGLLAVLFTQANLRVVKWRRSAIRPYNRRRIVESICIAITYAFICYIIALMGPCSMTVAPHPANQTAGVQEWQTENATELVSFMCHKDGEYSGLATLMLGMGKGNIRHFFTRRTVDEFSFGSVLTSLVVYFTFAFYTSGSAVSSGLVVPMIIIGATTGRLYGIILYYLFGSSVPKSLIHASTGAYWVSEGWMDPGVYALIGAGAFFAGTSRLTISVSVIMVELSGELHYLLPLMVAIVVSKAVADLLCVPLYHQMLHLDFVPYLPDEGNVVGIEVEAYTAEDVMHRNVVCLQARENTTTILTALRTNQHQAFPVVEMERGTGPRQVRWARHERGPPSVPVIAPTAKSSIPHSRPAIKCGRLERRWQQPGRGICHSTGSSGGCCIQ